MPDVIISDTSCLIVLGKVEATDLCYKLYKSVAITSEIIQE